MRTKESLTEDVDPVPVGPSPSSLKINRRGKKNQISMRDVHDAAARIGMEQVYMSQIDGYHVLGEYIEECGAIPIGRSILLMAHQHLSKGLKKCDQLLSEDLGVEETTAILTTLQGLATAQIKAAGQLIESDSRSDTLRNQDEAPVLPPPPRQTVVPIQANHVTIMSDGRTT